jgi:NADH-quinone oxidoreductase subunit N
VLGLNRAQSPEAALKYLVLGGVATATLLMGMSLMFGWSGSLALPVFAAALLSGDPLALSGAALVTAALFLKAAIVPLHTWAPDAYEGASAPVTAYMAAIVKAAVLLAALRVFGVAPVTGPAVGLVAALPLLSMAWGNLAAIRQTSVRRMIAYSSIAHAGYLFFAFLGDGDGRWEAIVFYLVTYGLMTVLVFAARTTSDRTSSMR